MNNMADYRTKLKDSIEKEYDDILGQETEEPEFSKEYKKKMEWLTSATPQKKITPKIFLRIAAVAVLVLFIVSWTVEPIRDYLYNFTFTSVSNGNVEVSVMKDNEGTLPNEPMIRQDVEAPPSLLYLDDINHSYITFYDELLDSEAHKMYYKTENDKYLVLEQYFSIPDNYVTEGVVENQEVIEIGENKIYLISDDDGCLHMSWIRNNELLVLQGYLSKEDMIELYKSSYYLS